MPERPELDYVVPVLRREVCGAEVRRFEVLDPVVLRVAVAADPRSALPGRSIASVDRRAHFVLFGLSGEPPLEIAVHPMLAGRFTLCDPGARRTKDTAIVLGLDRGDLRYRDDRQMGKVYVLDPARRDEIPGLAPIGLDVLDPAAFSREAFRAIARPRRDQAKTFLLDKTALDSLGNAYADESLWAAGVHPKAMVRELDAAALDRLHDAIVETLAGACAEVARRAPPIDEKVRDFLGVRNRKGEPCPRCGTTVRTCGVNGHDAFFCPKCQPDRRGRGLVDWGKVGR